MKQQSGKSIVVQKNLSSSSQLDNSYITVKISLTKRNVDSIQRLRSFNVAI